MTDEQWRGLEGGYRLPLDPRPMLARLRGGDVSAWNDLWQDLHHQQDVGVASYAAVPELVEIHRERDVPDWNTYALIGTIETCRQYEDNPPLPKWLAADYTTAWNSVPDLACRDLLRTKDETTVRAALSAIAIAKNVRPLGDLILNYSGEELAEMVDAYTGS